MTKAEEYVKHLYSSYEGRAAVSVGIDSSFKNIHPFVYEDENNFPLGLVGMAANNKEDTTEVQLYHICAFKPGKGHGSKMMQALCIKADQYNVRLYLQADVQFSGSETLIGDDLVNWYRKFGFSGNVIMRRDPNA